MEQFLGTILAFGFNFAPRGWQFCSGQLLSISQNSALFSLLGTYYGGNGQSTFALPDLRGRTMVGQGQGPGLSPVVIGQTGGTETTTLLIPNMPSHAHPLVAGQAIVDTVVTALAGNISNDPDNGNNSFATGGNTPNIYSEPSTTTSKVGGITSTISGITGVAGGNQPFSIQSPYLGINYCIALEGIFPSRN